MKKTIMRAVFAAIMLLFIGQQANAATLTYPYPGHPLQLNSTGTAVQELQKALGVTATGYFGPITLSKVKSYQSSHHLAVDGSVGLTTWDSIFSVSSTTSANTVTYTAYKGTLTITTATSLYASPSPSAKVVEPLAKGSKWKLYGHRSDGWYNIGAGWVKASCATIVVSGGAATTSTAMSTTTSTATTTPASTPVTYKAYTGIATITTATSLYASPSSSATIVEPLAKGSQWKLYGDQSDGWYNIGAGWVKASCATIVVSGGATTTSTTASTATSTTTPASTPVTYKAYAGIATITTATSLYARASSSATIVEPLTKGSQWKSYGYQSDGWYNIGAGWVKASCTSVTTTPPTSTTLVATSVGKTIVIDPGHGGWDVGATALDGTYEKDYNYQFAVKVQSALQAKGYKVILTRPQNNSCIPGTTNTRLDLQCRVDVATNNHANLFISIHGNMLPGNNAVRGTEVYYNADNTYDGHENPYPAQSERLANDLDAVVPSAVGTVNRGVSEDDYYVNRMATVPSVLVELGFLSNQSDLNLLKSSTVQSRVGEAFANAVDTYFKQ